MKNTLLILALAFATLAAAAKDKSKPVDLTGNWKEVRRISLRQEALDYTDTTCYDFMVGNEYTVQRKNSFMYRGTYKITPGLLDLGMRSFSIVEMTKDKMMLKDDAGTYKFVRYDKMASEAENNGAAASGARAFKEEITGANVNLGQLAGKWEVYKRTSSATLPEIDYTRIVQMIEIRKRGDTVGTVASAKDMEGAPSWNIMRYDGGVLYCNGPKGARQLKVLSYKPGELIVGEEPLTYFFKQFK